MYRLKTQIVVLLHVDAEFSEILNVEFISESDIFPAESEFFVVELEWRGIAREALAPLQVIQSFMR